jgi:hypothetical protein
MNTKTLESGRIAEVGDFHGMATAVLCEGDRVLLAAVTASDATAWGMIAQSDNEFTRHRSLMKSILSCAEWSREG